MDPLISSQVTANKIHIRWMLRCDLNRVCDIDAMCFPDPWDEAEFTRIAGMQKIIPQVIEFGEEVCGFMIYELRKSSVRVVTFAVHPEWRRRGFGMALIGRLKAKLSSHRRNRITLDVSERNLDAQIFFKRMGFLALRVNRDATDEGDTYRMVYRYEGD